MTRRRALCAFALLASACKNPGDKMEVLPMTLGEWHRLSVENIPPEEHSDELKRSGIQRARRATYHVPGHDSPRITASVYEFGASAVAFELVQKWRPEPHAIALQEGAYFVILKTERDDNQLLNTFAALLEKVLKR